VTNPASLRPFYCIPDISPLLDCVIHLHFSHIRSKLSSPSFSAPHFNTFQVTMCFQNKEKYYVSGFRQLLNINSRKLLFCF
jgi:hypothetical protein